MHFNWRQGIRRVRTEFRRRVRKDRFLDALVRHLQRTRTTTVLDVGGNYGQYGLLLRALGYRGTIISFEPVQQSFERLAREAASDPGWKVHRLALGETSGDRSINILPRSDFNSFKDPNALALDEFDGVAPIAKEKVSVTRLDDVVRDLLALEEDESVFLKTDTQGFDLEVLRGAGESTSRFNGLQAELSVTPLYEGVPPLTETLLYYESLGLKPLAFRTFAWSAGKLIEMDGLFRNDEWRAAAKSRADASKANSLG